MTHATMRTLALALAAALTMANGAMPQPVSASGGWIIVDGTGDTVAADGICTLREALTAANTDAPVGGCAAGSGADLITFSTPDPISVTAYLPTVTSTITIEGHTVLDGGGTSDLLGVGEYGVLTVRNVWFQRGRSMFVGGALKSYGTLVVQSCRFDANTTDADGGAIFAMAGTLSVSDSVFMNNASAYGGAIYSAVPTTIKDSLFRSNHGTYGGAVSMNTGTIAASEFTLNEASVGGAIHATVGLGGPLAISDSRFRGNLASTRGGSLELEQGVATVARSIFREDLAVHGASIDTAPATNLTVTDSLIRDAVAANDGGAIRARGDAVVTGSTLAANHATNGGAIAATAGLAIIDSTLAGNTASSGGGGALQVTGATTVSGSMFRANQASVGGAINADLADAAELHVTGSDFKANVATTWGGAIRLGTGSAVLYSDDFVANTATDGGALVVSGGTSVSVDTSDLSLNTAAASGGAIYNAGTLSVHQVRADRNVAPSGGAIVQGGSLVVYTTSFADNLAGDPVNRVPVGNGGAIHVVSGATSTTIVRSSFTGNSASLGGALRTEAPVSIANSTLADNTGGFGGAINGATGLELRNVTVSGNEATIGGGLYLLGPSIVLNTIVAGNTITDVSGSGTEDVGGAFAPTASHSLVGVPADMTLADIFTGARSEQTAALVVLPLTPNNPANPAVDSADPAVCAASPVNAEDLRGRSRPAACDMGAFELDNVAPTVSAPAVSLRTGVRVSGSAVPVHLTWSGDDDQYGTGIAAWTLQRSTDGGATWVTLGGTLTGTSYDTTMTSGQATRFRVRATDHDGTTSSWAATLRTASLVQQTAATVTRTGTWSTATGTGYSGGSTSRSIAKGASTTLVFTGYEVALVSTLAMSCGRVNLYADSKAVDVLDLQATDGPRFVLGRQAFGTSARHTLKVVVQGTAGRPRVDVDAFVVLK